MFTRSKHIAPRAIALLAAILSTAALGIALPMSDQTSTVNDPVGDTYFNAPAFQDIVLCQLTKTASGDFELRMEMAGPVPVAPPLPRPGVRGIWWAWFFDLDLTTAPMGYPLPPGYAPPPTASGASEFAVYVSWDGAAFSGAAIDRRPLLTGGEAIITPVTFSINGTTVEAELAFTVIGAVPPSFVWHGTTRDYSGPVGSLGWNAPDNAWAVFTP